MIADWDSPLANFFGMKNARFVSDSELLTDETELALQRCMAEKGFEYEPGDPDAQYERQFSDGLKRDTLEWTAVYGFGVSTLQFGSENVPGLVGIPPQVWPVATNTHVAKLSLDEQQAWTDQQGKCHDIVFAAERARVAPFAVIIGELDNYFRAVWDRAETDSRYVSWVADSKARLAEKGYRYSHNMADSFERRLGPIYDLDRPSTEFLTELGKLQQEEVEAAVAYGKCNLLDFQLWMNAETFIEAFVDAETAYIAEHKQSLTALRDNFDPHAAAERQTVEMWATYQATLE